MNHELWSLRVILIIHMERAIFYDDRHLSINIFRTHWNPFILNKWVDVDFDTGSKTIMNAELRLKVGKNLSSKRWKSLNIFQTSKKKYQNHFFTKTIDFYKNAFESSPILTFFEKSAPETTSKLHKLTVSMLYRSLKPPGYILGLWKSLYTNLCYDESVIYSLIFCYIRYYTNI